MLAPRLLAAALLLAAAAAAAEAPTIPRALRIAPKSGQVKQLVVILHGVGSKAEDLATLPQHWRDALPDAEFLLPDAIEPYDGTGGDASTRQWFAVHEPADLESAEGVAAASAVLEPWLAAELAKRRLPPSRLALVGFSQGGMIALHLAVNAALPPRAVVGFSTRHNDAGTVANGPRPRVLLVHGEADDVIGVESLRATIGSLRMRGIRPKSLRIPGLGHRLYERGARAGGEFLRRAFRGQ